MKSLVFILFLTLGSFISSAEGGVDPRVVEAFEKDFGNAKDVNWIAATNYYKADFTFNDQYVSAYYGHDAEFIGLTRFIASSYLPVYLQVSLKKSYRDFWITDIIEFTRDDRTTYFVTLENAARNVILSASPGDDWAIYKKLVRDDD